LDGSDAPLAKSDGTEMVLLVGPPACGKSTITATHFPKYTRVNQDILKTKKKCLDVASSEVSAGKSVVIDATNKDPETRRDWVQLARELAVPIRAVYVDIPKELSMHMNVFRGCNPKSADPRKVPDMIIHGFYKNAVKPTVRLLSHWHCERSRCVITGMGLFFPVADERRVFRGRHDPDNPQSLLFHV
jgi:bifunctional polynucleotide phosphatase/kinase